MNLFFPRTFIRTLYDVRVLRSGLGTLGKKQSKKAKKFYIFSCVCVCERF